jgi:hypothetical protein
MTEVGVVLEGRVLVVLLLLPGDVFEAEEGRCRDDNKRMVEEKVW